MRQLLIVAGCLMAAMPLAWIAANTVSSPARGKEPRFPQLTLEQLNDQQRPVGEKIVKISSVGLGGPYNPMLRSPVYAQRMYDLLDYLRWHTSVPTKLNEMAILVVSRQWLAGGMVCACPVGEESGPRRFDHRRLESQQTARWHEPGGGGRL